MRCESFVVFIFFKFSCSVRQLTAGGKSTKDVNF